MSVLVALFLSEELGNEAAVLACEEDDVWKLCLWIIVFITSVSPETGITTKYYSYLSVLYLYVCCRYYGVCCLNQFILGPNDDNLAIKLMCMYFTFFKVFIPSGGNQWEHGSMCFCCLSDSLVTGFGSVFRSMCSRVSWMARCSEHCWLEWTEPSLLWTVKYFTNKDPKVYLMNGCLNNSDLSLYFWLLVSLLYTCWVWTLTQVRFLRLRITYTHCSRWYMWVHWQLVSRLSCSCSKSWNRDRQFRGGSTRPCMPSWWTQRSNTPANRPVLCHMTGS